MGRLSGVAKSLMIISCCVLSTTAMAEKVAVISVQQALFSSQAAIQFREQLQQQLNGDQQRILRLESEAQRLRSKIEASEGKVTDQQRGQMSLQFRKVFEQYQQASEQLQATRSEREREFLSTMRPKLDSVIRQLIEQQGIDVVIKREQTVYAKPALDLTEQVIEGLNLQP